MPSTRPSACAACPETLCAITRASISPPPLGTGVFAAAEGSVLRTGYDPAGYGRFVEIRHPNGMTTLYGHLSRVDVASGDGVGTGEGIGLVGSTGRSTGPHLHFEVRRGDRQVNPVKVMGRTFEVVIAT